ncbi:MAG: SBBP repeat-containing protein [Gammaproteobacteria bacterium]
MRGNASDGTSTASTALRMQLVGANAKPRISGADALPGKVNYLRGNDPKQWRTNIPTYAKVKYENVYPGIDVVYYGNQRQLEHDFVVAPGADPKTIRLAFVGAENLAVDSQGDLVLISGGGELRLHKPLVYQEIAGKRRKVDGGYLLHTPKEKAQAKVGFQLAAYDTNQPLVIDPVLAYSTFLGGSKYDVATSIAVDSAKNVYVTGHTRSSDFPVLTGGYDTSFNNTAANPPPDVFVTKLNASGSARVYSTYVGGSDEDVGHDIAVDTTPT